MALKTRRHSEVLVGADVLHKTTSSLHKKPRWAVTANRLAPFWSSTATLTLEVLVASQRHWFSHVQTIPCYRRLWRNHKASSDPQCASFQLIQTGHLEAGVNQSRPSAVLGFWSTCIWLSLPSLTRHTARQRPSSQLGEHSLPPDVLTGKSLALEEKKKFVVSSRRKPTTCWFSWCLRAELFPPAIDAM